MRSVVGNIATLGTKPKVGMEMKKYIPVMHQIVVGITCDRCQSFYSAETSEFDAFITIPHSCRFGSAWQDGQAIEVDLCEKCLHVLVGDFCRVIDDDDELENHHQPIQQNEQQENPWGAYFESAKRVTGDFLSQGNEKLNTEALKQMVIEMMQGDEKAAHEWLTTPLEIFKGKTPLEQASEPEGLDDVIALIERIRNGAFS